VGIVDVVGEVVAGMSQPGDVPSQRLSVDDVLAADSWARDEAGRLVDRTAERT
jgi:hypothetical protein